MGVAAGREDLHDAAADLKDAHVKGSAAEVEDLDGVKRRWQGPLLACSCAVGVSGIIRQEQVSGAAIEHGRAGREGRGCRSP